MNKLVCSFVELLSAFRSLSGDDLAFASHPRMGQSHIFVAQVVQLCKHRRKLEILARTRTDTLTLGHWDSIIMNTLTTGCRKFSKIGGVYNHYCQLFDGHKFVCFDEFPTPKENVRNIGVQPFHPQPNNPLPTQPPTISRPTYPLPNHPLDNFITSQIISMIISYLANSSPIILFLTLSTPTILS